MERVYVHHKNVTLISESLFVGDKEEHLSNLSTIHAIRVIRIQTGQNKY